jgi:hypothetical protein
MDGFIAPVHLSVPWSFGYLSHTGFDFPLPLGKALVYTLDVIRTRFFGFCAQGRKGLILPTADRL